MWHSAINVSSKTKHEPLFFQNILTQESINDSNLNIVFIFSTECSRTHKYAPHTHKQTHTHAPLCTRLHHQSTALLSKLFDPRSRVLSAVPPSEFQRFWDNSNVSRHILGPPMRQWRRWKMPPWSPAHSPSIVSTL